MSTRDADTAAQEGRLTKMAEMRHKLDEIDAELVSLHERSSWDDTAQERWDDLVAERDTVEPEYKKLEERAARIDEIKKKTYREIHGMPEFVKPIDELIGRDIKTLSWREARDGALRLLDDKDVNYPLRSHQMDIIDKEVRDSGKTDLARRILVTENEHYHSAWKKLLTDPNAATMLSREEAMAMRAYAEYRAQSETSAAGGYAIPVFIDPSIILTDQETNNPFLSICRQVDVNTNSWKGVNSAGVSWSFDSEAAAVSDDSLTSIAQPTVTVYQARGFIPYSIEIGEDWPGFQSEMARVLAIGYDELLIDKFSRGSGSEPKGILTSAAAATPTTIVTSTTDGAFGQEDVYATWKALPQKYRNRASWMMNVGVMNAIRQFGSSNVYHAYSVGIMQGAVENLFGRPVYESPYFPDLSTTTGSSNRLVVGDFSNYVIARRHGMTVEFIPQLFDQSTGRPSGSRGWFAHARIGGSSVNDAAFRLQANT